MMRFFAVLVVVALLGCAEQQPEYGPAPVPRYTMAREGVNGSFEVLTVRDAETGEEWRVLYVGYGEGRALSLLSHEVSP